MEISRGTWGAIRPILRELEGPGTPLLTLPTDSVPSWLVQNRGLRREFINSGGTSDGLDRGRADRLQSAAAPMNTRRRRRSVALDVASYL